MTGDDDRDDAAGDDQVDAEADIAAIETKRLGQPKQAGSYSTHLAANERVQFVNRLAIMAEHNRRLAEQVRQLKHTPCVEPPPREVLVQPGPDPREADRLRSELRVLESQVEEHVRQKAALRVQVNQLSGQLDKARAELAEANKPKASPDNVKTAPQPAAPTRPSAVTSSATESSVKNPKAVPTPARDLVIAFLRGRASSANARFIAERIGFSLTAAEVDLAIAALKAAGLVAHVDLAGTPTWKATA
jgi:hypothetical protein